MTASCLRAGRLSSKRWMLRRPKSFCRRSLLVVADVAWLQNRSGFAIGSIVGISRPSPASYAAGRRAKRTTFASLSRVRLAARSATNTPFQSAACTTANCAAMAMRPHGGPESASTRYPSPLSSGSVSMRLRRARHSKLVVQTDRRRFERPRDCHGARGKWAAATVTNIMRRPKIPAVPSSPSPPLSYAIFSGGIIVNRRVTAYISS